MRVAKIINLDRGIGVCASVLVSSEGLRKRTVRREALPEVGAGTPQMSFGIKAWVPSRYVA